MSTKKLLDNTTNTKSVMSAYSPVAANLSSAKTLGSGLDKSHFASQPKI